MFTPVPRVMVPATVAKGELFTVKTLIGHKMDTGFRRDPQGEIIPRKIINKFVCRYDGIIVFSVDLHEAVAANPFIEFHLRATGSGFLEFVWEEDGGAVYRLEHRISVA